MDSSLYSQQRNKEIQPCSYLPMQVLMGVWQKEKCDEILNNWKMTFQAFDAKGRQFLELLDDDIHPIEPSYSKGRLWLKFFGHSDLLCARASRAIVNYAPIGEYCLRFFPQEEFKCPCRQYLIEMRQHILYECRRFNNY